MRVALIGDSHSEATFPMLRQKLVAKGHDVVFQLSKRGWATYSFFDKGLLSQLRESNPDAVIVSLGGNNHRLDETVYDGIVAQFLQEIGHPSTMVTWIGPFASNPTKAASTAHRHEWTSNFLRTHLPKNVTFIDTTSISQSGHEPDGVHFTYKSYQKMMDALEDRILKSLGGTWLAKVKRAAPIGFFTSAFAALVYLLYSRRK